ncbi:MAG: hypothetical protein R3B07_12870 [Polyangiaceae bacterium]
MRRCPAWPLLALSLLSAPAAHAQEHEDEGDLGPSPRTLVRPHGAAEAGVGLLTLPGAEVCVDVTQGCETGDTSLSSTHGSCTAPASTCLAPV